MPPQDDLALSKVADSPTGEASSTQKTPPSLLKQILNVADTFIAMSGWRITHLNVPWVIGGVLSLATGQLLIKVNNPTYTLVFFVFSLLFYYGGNSWILASKFPQRLIERYGEDRAFRLYETVLAFMFINQGLGVGCMTSLSIEGLSLTLPISPWLAYGIGGILFATGLVVKVWATVVLSVDIYYYRDLFLNRRVSEFVSSGPYKVFSNPMYGIGQIHGYGYAILNRSLGGLIAIGLCHILIYVFYFAVERPFVRRVYLSGAQAA